MWIIAVDGASSPSAALVWAEHRKGFCMSKACAFFRRLLHDEQGGEVLEYALVAGLIIVTAIAVIGTVGTKVLGRWSSLNSSM
jgi:pilus assembly protein Flp/PilA